MIGPPMQHPAGAMAVPPCCGQARQLEKKQAREAGMLSLSRRVSLLLGAGAVAVALSLGGQARAGSVPESTDPIKLAINEWTGQHITTYIAGEILTRMGYRVEYVTAGSYPQYTGIADGSLTATL